MSLGKLTNDLSAKVHEVLGGLVLGNDLFRDVQAELATEVELHGSTEELTLCREKVGELAGTLQRVSEIATLRAAELRSLAGQ